MVARDRQVLRAPATAHVEAMRGEAEFESTIREAARVTRIARSFETMDENHVPLRLVGRKLRMYQHLDVGRGAIRDGLYRPLVRAYRAAPEIARNRSQVRVAEQRIERNQGFGGPREQSGSPITIFCQ